MRHRDTHLVATMAKAAAAEVAEVAHGSDLRSQANAGLARALGLVEAAQEILDRARDEADHATALDAVRASAVALKEARAHVELLGKASGELGPNVAVQVNVLSSPDWQRLRDALVARLEAVPGGLEALAQAAADVEGTSATPQRG